jgi:peptidoglycan LD-endopeptidase LytH
MTPLHAVQTPPLQASQTATGLRWWQKFAIATFGIFLIGLLIPDHPQMPVLHASAKDWHPKSFWFEPWGRSGVHKGIDIFAAQRTKVLVPVSGIVLYRGELGLGGNVVLMLGPKWRLHYFAHLHDDSMVNGGWFYRAGASIGYVGDTGNARGKPPHLHYSILTLYPRPWAITRQNQGWKRMFFSDPSEYLSKIKH